jgi:hypothetical protein
MSVLSRPSSTAESSISVIRGRPDIGAKVHDIVAGIEAHERIIVAACGPDSLMMETRRAVAALVATQDRSATLHCEQLGWSVTDGRIRKKITSQDKIHSIILQIQNI